jgi:hypothetical protein
MFLEYLRNAGDSFTACCPKADDLWLHVQALRAGFKVRQISKKLFRLAIIPNTQSVALWNDNGIDGNDRQIAATYTESDIRIMLEE